MPWRYRKFLLAILAVLLLARTAEWFLPDAPEPDESETISGEEFVLEPHFEGMTLFSEQDELLTFDPSDNIWTFGGETVDDLSRHVIGFEIGPHGSSPFVVIRLPEGATADTYRGAISSLADQGICRVGVASPSPASELESEQYRWNALDVQVYNVVRYRPGFSPSQECLNRFPAWR